ncbi:MAG: DUF6788 family protein [Acidimicrobiales bacterium]
MELTAAQRLELRRISTELASVGPCLPGSVVIRQGRCGKSGCSCRAEPPRLHGPFRSWTRKVAKKTVTRLLSEEQLAAYQPYFDNDRQLKALLHQLEQLGLDIVATDSGHPSR